MGRGVFLFLEKKKVVSSWLWSCCTVGGVHEQRGGALANAAGSAVFCARLHLNLLSSPPPLTHNLFFPRRICHRFLI